MRGRSRSGGCDRRRSGRTPRGSFRGRFFRGAFGFGGRFGVGDALQMTLHFFSDIGGNRAGVSLLFGDSKAMQKVNDGFGLDLQLASQLVNADLGCVAHAS
jgi:hypothetical protein